MPQLYSGSTADFLDQTTQNLIAETLRAAFFNPKVPSVGQRPRRDRPGRLHLHRAGLRIRRVDLAARVDKLRRNDERYPPDAVRGRADQPPR